MHNEERTFLNANQCVLLARHCTTLSVWEACGPPDLEYNARNMAVFMDNKIACDTIISKITIFGLFYQQNSGDPSEKNVMGM
jgi:hypothetical protein